MFIKVRMKLDISGILSIVSRAIPTKSFKFLDDNKLLDASSVTFLKPLSFYR